MPTNAELHISINEIKVMLGAMQKTIDDFVVIKKRVSPVQGRGAWTQGAGRIHDQGVEEVQTVSFLPILSVYT